MILQRIGHLPMKSMEDGGTRTINEIHKCAQLKKRKMKNMVALISHYFYAFESNVILTTVILIFWPVLCFSGTQ